MAQTNKNRLLDALDRVVAGYRETPDDVLLARLDSYTDDEYGVFLGLIPPSPVGENSRSEWATAAYEGVVYSLSDFRFVVAHLHQADVFAANDYDYALAA